MRALSQISTTSNKQHLSFFCSVDGLFTGGMLHNALHNTQGRLPVLSSDPL